VNFKSSLSIGDVAARAGLRTSAIRWYERVGVLPEPERVGGRRRYGPEVLDRLAVVDTAQRAGLTLEEIRELLEGADAGEPVGDRLRALAERKLPEVEALIARAEAVRGWLRVAADCRCPTFEECALFEPGHAPEQPPAPLSGVPR
jgi:MerR family transcriptional regulator, redox-sensitive transcriptional activator SoxR